ncbi:MAG: hypothetical protein WCD65_22560 [Pseudolabrys sp.]|jgi:hypothetical protein
MSAFGGKADIPFCTAHEKETVAYLMPRQTHAIDYDPFNPPEDVWQDGLQGRAEDAPSF